MNRNQRVVFISATKGYSIYYVCRLSLSVIKAPLVQEGELTESQLGLIGSGLFYVYAVGKLVNGFLADSANINRFLTIGPIGYSDDQPLPWIQARLRDVCRALGSQWLASVHGNAGMHRGTCALV